MASTLSERGARRFWGSRRATDSAVVPFGWDAAVVLPGRREVRVAVIDVISPRWVPIVTVAAAPALSWFDTPKNPPGTIAKRHPEYAMLFEVRGPPLAAFPRADVWGQPNGPNPTAKRAAPQFVDSGKVTFTPVTGGFTPTADDYGADDELPPKGHPRRAAVYLPHSPFVSLFPDFAPDPDTWHRDAVVPVRRKETRQDARNDFVSTFPDFAPKSDAWHRDAIVPVRRIPARSPQYDQPIWGDFVTPPDIPAIPIDRWNADPVVPVRRSTRAPHFTIAPAYVPTIVAVIATVDTWHVDPKVPVRQPASNAQQERYGAVTLTPAPVYFPLPDSWHQDFVVPVRRVLRQPLAQPAYVHRFTAVIATPDMFHRDAQIPVRRSLRRPELISGFGFAPYPIATPAQTVFNIVDVVARFAQTRTESVEFQQQLAEEVRFALIRYVDGEF